LPEIRAGRYELLAKLATGGMGEVFVARQTGSGEYAALHFEKRIALKLMLPHMHADPELVHMFMDEARLAARMSHPNIIPIFDLGEADGRFYIAMQLVEGVSLSRLLRLCRVGGVLPPLPMVRLIAAGLLNALSYAHDLKDPRGRALEVVHRDITPSNVLLSASGNVLLTDFGIAKARDNLHHTRPGKTKGKCGYMAPEQMRSSTVDRRADLFAAAVTVYELLTLVHPFVRGSELETMRAIDSGAAVTPPSVFRPELGPLACAAVLRAMAHDPGHRFSTAHEFLDALIDGPTAAAHELGAWLESICPEDLAAFRGMVYPEAAHVLETASAILLNDGTDAEGAQEKELSGGVTSVDRPRTRRLLYDRSAPPTNVSEAHRLSVRWHAAWLGAAVAAVSIVAVVGWRVVRPDAARPEAAPGRSAAPSPSTAQAGATSLVVTVEEPPGQPAAGAQDATAEPPTAAPAQDAAVMRTTTAVSSRARSAAKASDGREKPAAAAAPLPTPAARVPRSAPATRSFGTLNADARPWAEVLLGDRSLGVTPLSHELPSGDHELVFRNPRYPDQRRRVRVRGGAVERLLIEFK
jgi:hypothetical protein